MTTAEQNYRLACEAVRLSTKLHRPNHIRVLYAKKLLIEMEHELSHDRLMRALRVRYDDGLDAMRVPQ